MFENKMLLGDILKLFQKKEYKKWNVPFLQEEVSHSEIGFIDWESRLFLLVESDKSTKKEKTISEYFLLQDRQKEKDCETREKEFFSYFWNEVIQKQYEFFEYPMQKGGEKKEKQIPSKVFLHEFTRLIKTEIDKRNFLQTQNMSLDEKGYILKGIQNKLQGSTGFKRYDSTLIRELEQRNIFENLSKSQWQQEKQVNNNTQKNSFSLFNLLEEKNKGLSEGNMLWRYDETKNSSEVAQFLADKDSVFIDSPMVLQRLKQTAHKIERMKNLKTEIKKETNFQKKEKELDLDTIFEKITERILEERNVSPKRQIVY